LLRDTFFPFCFMLFSSSLISARPFFALLFNFFFEKVRSSSCFFLFFPWGLHPGPLPGVGLSLFSSPSFSPKPFVALHFFSRDLSPPWAFRVGDASPFQGRNAVESRFSYVQNPFFRFFLGPPLCVKLFATLFFCLGSLIREALFFLLLSCYLGLTGVDVFLPCSTVELHPSSPLPFFLLSHYDFVFARHCSRCFPLLF